LWLTAAAACGSGVPELLTSGSRLKASYWSGPDGLRMPSGWYDSQLGSPCRFERSASGDYVCVPVSASLAFLGTYLDAACTQPVAIVQAQPCAPVFAMPFVIDRGTCEQPTAYPIGDVLPSSTPIWGTSSAGCTRAGTPTGELHALGAPLDAGAFVHAVAQPASQSTRLRSVFLHADDGAREWIDELDSQLGFRCAPRAAADGSTRCMPTNSTNALAFQYSDVLCSSPIVPADDCSTPDFVSLNQSCGARIFRASGPASVQTVYDQPSCVPRASTGASSWIGVGDEIAATAMVAVDKNAKGSGRFSEHVAQASDGTLVARAQGWFDRQLGSDVQILSLTPGSYALLPSEPAYDYSGDTFEDSACTQPLVATPKPYGCQTMDPFPIIYSWPVTNGQLTSCSVTAFDLGATVTPATVYRKSSDPSQPCVAATTIAGSSYVRFGSPVDPSKFAKVTPTHD
jgi:hypothetical protein